MLERGRGVSSDRTSVLIKRWKRQRRRGARQQQTEAGTGMTWPRAHDHPGLPEPGRCEEGLQKEHGPASTPISDLSPPEPWDRNFLSFQPPSVWYLFVQPPEPKQRIFVLLASWLSPMH